ncbi:MAG: hypothetical protein JO264_19880 [Acidisphaera sp.]|nr:hypothetical protein [Acidisphaera sp.]
MARDVRGALMCTAHGTLVYLDEATGTLRHGPIATVPANLFVTCEGDKAAFRFVRNGQAPVVVDRFDAGGCGLAGPENATRRLTWIGKRAVEAQYEGDGRFLSAEPDGEVSFTRNVGLVWESFLLLAPEQLDSLRFFLRHEWMSHPGYAARRHSFAAQADRRLRSNFAEFGIEQFLNADDRRGGSARCRTDLELLIEQDGGDCEYLRLYRPLAYFAAFGKPEIFDCAELAIRSLFGMGEWRGDVLLLTDARHRDFAQRFPETLRASMHVAVLQADDTLDYTLARYKVGQVPLAREYQPLLYLDTDVICDAPLDSLLAGMVFSHDLMAVPEFDLMIENDHYGKTLFERDGRNAVPGERGFSTGILGFRRVRDVEPLFDGIVRCAYDFASSINRRDFFAEFDQPFANYIAHKMGGFDLETLQPWSTGIFHVSDPVPAGRRGLAHFAGGVGNAARKTTRMREYLRALARAVSTEHA